MRCQSDSKGGEKQARCHTQKRVLWKCLVHLQTTDDGAKSFTFPQDNRERDFAGAEVVLQPLHEAICLSS